MLRQQSGKLVLYLIVNYYMYWLQLKQGKSFLSL